MARENDGLPTHFKDSSVPCVTYRHPIPKTARHGQRLRLAFVKWRGVQCRMAFKDPDVQIAGRAQGIQARATQTERTHQAFRKKTNQQKPKP